MNIRAHSCTFPHIQVGDAVRHAFSWDVTHSVTYALSLTSRHHLRVNRARGVHAARTKTGWCLKTDEKISGFS
jgi:hypothetical protein